MRHPQGDEEMGIWEGEMADRQDDGVGDERDEGW